MDNQEILSRVGEKTSGAVHRAGELIADAGASLWEAAPSEGKVGEALGSVAAKIEESGLYLSEHSARDLAGDLGEAIRNNPVPAALAMFGAGVLFGALLVRR